MNMIVEDRPQDLLPEDFLRPPSYYDNKCKNSVMAMNQEQQDHLMAMQLQQQMLDNQANQRYAKVHENLEIYNRKFLHRLLFMKGGIFKCI